MRKIIAILVAVVVVSGVSLTFAAPAPDAVVMHYGTVTENGSNLPWRLYDDGTLIVEGGYINWTEIEFKWEEEGEIRSTMLIQSPWGHNRRIYKIIFTEPIIARESLKGLFVGLENVSNIKGLHYLDTSNVTDMSWMFLGLRNVVNLDLSYFDTSNVIYMNLMFRNMSSLTTLNVSAWNTSNVTDMSGMFSGASGLTSIDISNWDTSNVADMSRMFSEARSLTSLDVSNWDTSNVTDMSGMFYGARGLTIIDISSWNTSNVADMSRMFSQARSLTKLDISNWDTSNVSDMSWMFNGMDSLTFVDISNWNTGNVTDMRRMFGVLPQLTLGESFVFVPSRRFDGTNILHRADGYTTYWRNVGTGTVDNPQGEFIFSSQGLINNFDGSIHADTWVWQRASSPDVIIKFNGDELEFAVPPLIINNRTVVCLGRMAQVLGTTLYSDGIRPPMVQLGDIFITFHINAYNANVYNASVSNRESIELDVPCLIINLRPMVPLRFIAETLGFYVDWCGDTNTVFINTAE